MTNYNLVAEDVAWTTFIEAFNTKFIPNHVRDKKMKEFENLKQGNMSVHDYDLEFTKLSQYAPKLVTPESERVRRFLQGLRPDIYLQIYRNHMDTYAGVAKDAFAAK